MSPLHLLPNLLPRSQQYEPPMSTVWAEEQSEQVITGEWVSWAVEIPISWDKAQEHRQSWHRAGELNSPST